MKAIERFLKDESGLETVEYAIILGIIVVATIGIISGIGLWVQGKFQAVNDQLPRTSTPTP